MSQPELLDANRIAAVARALAHPARVRIIAILLSRPGCIGGDIVDEIGLAQSTVSEHFRILKAAGLVQGEIDYPRICYSLNSAALEPVRALMRAIDNRANDADDDCCYTPQCPERRETTAQARAADS